MPTGKKRTTIESKTLTVAIKRAMATRGIRTPGLAKTSGIPYGTLRRILELNTVADYEQLQKIANALRTPLSQIVADAEHLTLDKDIAAEFKRERNERKKALANTAGVDAATHADGMERHDAATAQPNKDAETTAIDEANKALASADNGIDIDAWADRIKAEESVRV